MSKKSKRAQTRRHAKEEKMLRLGRTLHVLVDVRSPANRLHCRCVGIAKREQRRTTLVVVDDLHAKRRAKDQRMIHSECWYGTCESTRYKQGLHRHSWRVVVARTLPFHDRFGMVVQINIWRKDYATKYKTYNALCNASAKTSPQVSAIAHPDAKYTQKVPPLPPKECGFIKLMTASML